MKQTLALILAAMLFCTALTPCVLAAEDPAVSAESGTTDTVTNSGSAADADDSFDTATPSNAGTVTVGDETTGTDDSSARADGTEDGAVPDSIDYTGSIISYTALTLTVSPAAITLTSFDEPDRTDAVAFAVGTSQEALADWFSTSVMGFSGYDVEGNYYDLISGEWNLDAVDTASAGVYYAWTSPDLGTEYTLADGVSLPRQLCAVSIQVPGEPDINCCVAGRGFLHFPWVLSAAQEEQLDAFNLWMRQDDSEWTSLSDGFLFVSDGLQLSQRVLTYGSTYELKVTYPCGQTGALTFQYDGELTILDYSGGDRDGGDAGGSDSGTGIQPAPNPPQTPGDSNEDNLSNGGSSTPAPDDSSFESGNTPQDHGSIPDELKTPQQEQDSSSDEIKSAPTMTRIPDTSENDGNHSSKVNSDASLSLKAENASPEPGNYAVPQTNDSSKAVMYPIQDDNDIQSEKIHESQVPATVTESYSPTQTIISGLRLKDLCKEEESVVFGSGDLTVSIPSKLLLALNLSDMDTLDVTLTQPESNQILFIVEVSGKSVSELKGAILRLRYEPQLENAEITVQSEDGEQITGASYDGEFLRFAADAAGTYTILQQSNTQEPKKSTLPLLPISGGLIIAAGGITFFRRIRHG